MTRTETFALTAIAYLQPVTRGEISKLAGREISRDVIAALKRHGLIDGAIRAPQPGEGLLQRDGGEADLDSALGVMNAEADDTFGDNDAELDDVEGF